MELNANIPSGPIDKKWDKHRFEMKLVNPANKRKYSVIEAGAERRGLGDIVEESAGHGQVSVGQRVTATCVVHQRCHGVAVLEKTTYVDMMPELAAGSRHEAFTLRDRHLRDRAQAVGPQ